MDGRRSMQRIVIWGVDSLAARPFVSEPWPARDRSQELQSRTITGILRAILVA